MDKATHNNGDHLACAACSHHKRRVATILYENHLGIVKRRRIIPVHIWFGSHAWRPQPQWMLDAIDVEHSHRPLRTFAMQGIIWKSEAGATPDSDVSLID